MMEFAKISLQCFTFDELLKLNTMYRDSLLNEVYFLKISIIEYLYFAGN